MEPSYDWKKLLNERALNWNKRAKMWLMIKMMAIITNNDISNLQKDMYYGTGRIGLKETMYEAQALRVIEQRSISIDTVYL